MRTHAKPSGADGGGNKRCGSNSGRHNPSRLPERTPRKICAPCETCLTRFFFYFGASRIVRAMGFASRTCVFVSVWVGVFVEVAFSFFELNRWRPLSPEGEEPEARLK